MVSQTISKLNRTTEWPRSDANDMPRTLPSARRRPSKLYSASAEVSYILRWLALKAAGTVAGLAPGPRDRREKWIINLGNNLFPPMYGREVYADYESYVSRMGASLDLYAELYPVERWLKGRDVLDLGSGLGQYSLELLRSGASSVTGLEYQVEKAHWSASRAASPRLRFVTGSAESMPFGAECFDAVFSHTVFEHIGDVEAALREVRRVLRPRGVALLSYNFYHHRGGHHLFPYVHFPWAPWIVREHALCDYWSERLAADQALGTMRFYETGARVRSLSEGAEIHLNKLNFEQFERLVEQTGLRIRARRSSEEFARLFPWLTRLPRLRYFFAGTFYYVLGKSPSYSTDD